VVGAEVLPAVIVCLASEHPELRNLSAMILRDCAGGSDAHRNAVEAAGAERHLVGCLSATGFAVVRTACEAIHRLAASSTVVCDRFVESGAIP